MIKNASFILFMGVAVLIPRNAASQNLHTADSSISSRTEKEYHDLFSKALNDCDFDAAMDYSDKYYHFVLRANNQDGIYKSLNEMFELNCQMGNLEKGFTYAQQLYDIAIQSGNKLWMENALWNLGRFYKQLDDYAEGLNYFRRAREINGLQVNKGLQPEGKEMPFDLDFAETFSNLMQFDSAWYYYQQYRSEEHTSEL